MTMVETKMRTSTLHQPNDDVCSCERFGDHSKNFGDLEGGMDLLS